VVSSSRRIAAGLVVLGLVLSALVGVITNLFAPDTIAANPLAARFGVAPPALTLPRSAIGPLSPELTAAPPMGWNGFNHFYHSVSAATVAAQANAIISSGMKAAGYRYVNLDGGWDLLWRSRSGSLQPDPAKFPQGIKPVADYVHSLGLRFGIYSSAGMENCAATSAGSYGHFRQDAALFAAWGVDYLKLDWCFIPYHNYPRLNRKQISQMLASEMADALAATGRLIVYDVNDVTNNEPWSSAPGRANLWRTTSDIQDKYSSMVWNFTHNVKHYVHAGPRGWNDPDMLEVGNGGMSVTEYQSQFSLWAEMAAPLIAGNDLATMSPVTQGILTNRAVIGVDQDPLGRQGYPVASAGGHWVLTKPLMNGDSAVVFFNQTDTAATITATATQVGMPTATEYSVLNLWTGTTAQTAGVITATVPPHGSVFYLLAENATPPFSA